MLAKALFLYTTLHRASGGISILCIRRRRVWEGVRGGAMCVHYRLGSVRRARWLEL